MKIFTTQLPQTDKFEEFRESMNRKGALINKAMFEALRAYKRNMAREYFELSVKYNELYELSNHCAICPEDKQHPVFLLDYWFLQDLIKHLTPHEDEEVVYITGNDYENIKMPYRIRNIKLEQQSVVYAKATAQSCSDVLIDLCERGYQVQLVAHSHPGSGPEATCPSSIDINYLAKIQDAGSDAVGLIVTRDGYARFFSVRTEFEVSIKGKGVQHVQENVFKIPLV